MSNQAHHQELRSLVEEFTDSLALAVRRSVLEHVVTAMGGNVARAKRGPGRPSARGAGSSAATDAMSERLFAHVKANPGQRGDQIAKALRSDVHTIRKPMKALIAAKKVKTKGQRRGMSYFAA
jgi:hypothetical protein